VIDFVNNAINIATMDMDAVIKNALPSSSWYFCAEFAVTLIQIRILEIVW